MSDQNTPEASEGRSLVEQMMESGGTIAPQDPASPGRDDLTEELRGQVDPAANDSPESEATEEDPTPVGQEVFEKLRKAQQDAGKAGWELGQERKEKAELKAQLDQLQAQVQAMQSGQPQQGAQPPEQGQEAGFAPLSDQQLEQFARRIDPDWEDNQHDPVKRYAMMAAANLSMESYRASMGEVQGVAGGVEEMRFNQRLSGLGIDRAHFDSIWENPAYSWGQNLTNDQKLAALESQATQMPVSGPSGAPPYGASRNPGAPDASRVDPRTMIEQTQATGSAQDPRRLSHLKLEQAMEEGKWGQAKQAARPLFQAMMDGQ